MPKVVTLPHGDWGNDAADWQGTSAEWREKMGQAEREAEAASQEQAASPLKVVDLANFTTVRAKPTEFIINPFVPRGFVTLLGGHGEIGKSLLGLILGAHVATGQSWAGLQVSQGKVLYLSMEDAGDIAVFRLQLIAEAYCLDPAALIANLTIIDASDAGPLAQEVNVGGIKSLLTTGIAEEVNKLVPAYDLIIIDNASDAFDGDENSRRQVRTFIKSLARWVKGHQGAVMLLVHIDKQAARNGAQGNTYSGSTAWHNSARSRLALTKNARSEAIELAHEKLNVGRKLEEPLCLEWSETGVLLPISAQARQSAKALADAAHDQDVYHALRAALAAGCTIPTATTGPTTAWHVLQPFPELPDALKDRSGKSRLDAALIRLSRQGLIRQEKYQKDYKTRERWVI
jgi:RecA-family ATPase